MSRRLIFLGAVTLSLSVASVIVFAISRDSDGEVGTSGQRRVLPERPGYCLGTAEEATLDEARAAAPFPLLMPDHALANVETLERVLLCPEAVVVRGKGLTAVRFEFASGVVVMQEWNDLRDPDATFSARDSEAGISMASVHGRTANVGEVSEERGGKGAVEWVEDDRHVIVKGNGMIDPAALLEVAESARPI